MRSESVVVDLSDRQEDVAEWLLSCPSMEEWFDPEHEHGHDFSHLDRPEIKRGKLFLEVDGHLLDNIDHELDRYQDMALNSGMSAGKSAGAVRVAGNLKEKVLEACSDEVLDDCAEIQNKRFEAVKEAGN